jgi:hypothetical protein
MKLMEIGWDDIVGVFKRKMPTVIAALCTARSDGKTSQYPAGERHTVLVMLRIEEPGQEPDLEAAVETLLEANGWYDGVILEETTLDQSFLSEDRMVMACYVNAMTSDGGCLVYEEPVED